MTRKAPLWVGLQPDASRGVLWVGLQADGLRNPVGRPSGRRLSLEDAVGDLRPTSLAMDPVGLKADPQDVA